MYDLFGTVTRFGATHVTWIVNPLESTVLVPEGTFGQDTVTYTLFDPSWVVSTSINEDEDVYVKIAVPEYVEPSLTYFKVYVRGHTLTIELGVR